ncbi:PIN domain-containing protein [Rummeliibacillus stabekisii]|uniref:PIN domain-containing protein n=1 Tax=Rummeliibacillus stabekisii TaxID=241244 RepID=UPI0011730697|nr:PIN domain-containing protein [Rummeliibacillus stabekisii]MBB5171617.1 hypothetical protein [Rummeliibacillus stabekisii]GEL05464.1 hypothetical protein RST01_20910 [Rummeliibacillus stabekisii]
MKYLALDTNIYLDMVVSRNKSHKPEAYAQMKKLLDYGEITLVVPAIVIREVNRHINNEIEKINSHLKLVKKNVESLYWINNIDEMKIFKEKIPNVTSVIKEVKDLFESNKERYISDAVNLFNDLFSHRHVICLEENQEILFKAHLRQLYKKRPFHYSKQVKDLSKQDKDASKQDKDSLADAVIIESLIEYTKKELDIDDCMYFITRNTVDFSADVEKDKLHPEIQESILSLNIENQFFYRIHFNKTLIDDFKLETENAGFLEEIQAEMEEENLKEMLKEVHVRDIEYHRELGGLTSLSADWEVIINENEDTENFIDELLNCTEELISQFDNLSQEHADLLDNIQKLDLFKIQQRIKNFNSKDNEKITITGEITDMQDAIIEIIDERTNIDIENYEATKMWKCDDYFTLNDTLLQWEDFGIGELTITSTGQLNPENEGKDDIEIEVNDTILNKNLKGSIEVSYGYLYFDEDNHPTDGMQEKVDVYLGEVIETVQDVKQHIIDQIQYDEEIIRDINIKLGFIK